MLDLRTAPICAGAVSGIPVYRKDLTPEVYHTLLFVVNIIAGLFYEKKHEKHQIAFWP